MGCCVITTRGWRVILWRSILCLGLALPLLQWIEIPGIKIPVGSELVSATDVTEPVALTATVSPTHPATSVAPPAQPLAAGRTTSTRPHVFSTTPRNISWNAILIAIWAVGCFCGAARLLRLQVQLVRLRHEAEPPTDELQRLATQIQTRLNLRKEISVQISPVATSPFVCGVLKLCPELQVRPRLGSEWCRNWFWFS